MRAPDLVHRFLTSIGRPAEAEAYLALFRSERPESFAVVVVEDEVADTAADALGAELRFLSELGLAPVIALRTAARQGDLTRHLGDALPVDAAEPDGARDLARAGRVAAVVAADDTVLAALLADLSPRKLVFVTTESGLQPAGEAVRSLVDLTTELDDLVPRLPPRQADLLRRIDALHRAAPKPLTVSITSPFDLLRELFTVKGAGTLVRRGARVALHQSYRDVDATRLEALMSSAFGRPPRPDFFARPIDSIYVADDYRGAAIVEARPLCPYLSKFAVDVQARGEGIGGDLWRSLCRDYPRLVWRSRAENPITGWYQQQCDGLVRAGRWHVFWRGLATDDLTWAVELALDAPVDF